MRRYAVKNRTRYIAVRNRLRFAILTLLLVMLTAFLVSETVRGQSRERLTTVTGYDRQMERDYICEVREILEEYGVRNSGINMTYVSEDGDERVYRIVIHNKAFRWLSEEEYDALVRSIEEIAFPGSGVEKCCINFKIL